MEIINIMAKIIKNNSLSNNYIRKVMIYNFIIQNLLLSLICLEWLYVCLFPLLKYILT